MLKTLLEIGFVEAGEWKLHDGSLKYELTKEISSKNVLYCFACDEEVFYVGKTTQSLKTRMNGYKNPGETQLTNIKSEALIKEYLQVGKTISIFVLADYGLLHYGKFHLNLAAGLEDSIIKELNPVWNRMGKKSH